MLRLGRPLLYAGARCPYTVLGVPRSASADQIKSAFKDRVKQTHPDVDAAGNPTKTQQFRDLVEAYRVLRDEETRRAHDRKADRTSTSQGPDGGRAGGADTTVERERSPSEGYTIVALFFFGVFLLSQMLPKRGPIKDTPERHLYPTKNPNLSKQKSVGGYGNAVSSSSSSPEEISTVVGQAAMMVSKSAAGGSVGMVDPEHNEAADEFVRAFYDPFFQMWYKIPDGYEAPSGMDLTAWHNKRADPVEWSRLIAEGKLSQIVPRGGVQVRYLPSWEAREPILVSDPFTGKTLTYDRALQRLPQETCEVQF